MRDAPKLYVRSVSAQGDLRSPLSNCVPGNALNHSHSSTDPLKRTKRPIEVFDCVCRRYLCSQARFAFGQRVVAIGCKIGKALIFLGLLIGTRIHCRLFI